MARKAAQSAPADNESNALAAAAPADTAGAGIAPSGDVQAGSVADDAVINSQEGAEPVAMLSAPPVVDGEAGDETLKVSEAGMVPALVLHDSIYGKCGEVREFDSSQVAAFKEAGYIDPHPNAVASAGA